MGSVQTLGVETFPGACRRPRATQFRAPHRAAITRRACSLTSFYPNKISDGAEITGPIALRPLPEPGSAVAQHDPAHWPAADALDAGEKLRVPCPAAAAVITHLGQDVADFAACTWFTMRSWPHRAPRWERVERLDQRLGAAGQRAGAVAPPMARGRPAHAGPMRAGRFAVTPSHPCSEPRQQPPCNGCVDRVPTRGIRAKLLSSVGCVVMLPWPAG